MSRTPPIAFERMTDRQRAVHDALVGGPRKAVTGPFVALLRSPELADRAQRLGEYCRFGSSLPKRLSEMAILMTARQWNAAYEWNAHAPLARAAGLDEAVIESIRRARTPDAMAADESIVHAFVTCTYRDKRIDDALYARAVAAFGEQGVADLVGLLGYYALVSITLNTFAIDVPAGVPPPFD